MENQIDWPTWLQSINLFQVAIVIVALYVVSRLLMRFWPWLRKVMELTAALAQLPAFIARTDRTLTAQAATLKAQDAKIEEIHHESTYNNETSMKDAVRRIELGVKGLYDRADLSDQATDQLRVDLEENISHPQEKP